MGFSLIVMGQPPKTFLWPFRGNPDSQSPQILLSNSAVTLPVSLVQCSSCEDNRCPWMWWGQDGEIFAVAVVPG